MSVSNSPAAWSRRADEADTSYDAALWSEAGQQGRFESVLSRVDPRVGETLLDFGCGTGAFSEVIPRETVYVGYDWSVGMIERARREHPSKMFVFDEPQNIFDVVVCIGPFNLPDNWSKRKTWRKIANLWGQTRRVLAVCLYAGDDLECLTYSELELEAFASILYADVVIERHRPNDLLMTLRRDKL